MKTSDLLKYAEKHAEEATDHAAKLTAITKQLVLMFELIDGAYDVVELWKVETPAQRKWRVEWLEKARKVGATPSL